MLQAEKKRSDELIAAGKHEEATLVVPPGYYWKWSGQFENQQRATERLSWMVPLVLFSMFVMIYMGLGRWWLAFIVFFGILVSASGGFALLLFYGSNLSVAVWVGFIALFGVADDGSVVILSFLEDKFKENKPRNASARSVRWLSSQASPRAAVVDDNGRDHGDRLVPNVLDQRPGVRRDAADGHSQRRRHGGSAHRLLAGSVPVLHGQGVAVFTRRAQTCRFRCQMPFFLSREIFYLPKNPGGKNERFLWFWG